MNRRGTTPITSTADRKAALAESRNILENNPTDADREYIRALGAAIDAFDEYCVERRDKIKPCRMIRYQLEVVKRIPIEQAARECGIGDLDQLMNAQRAFTARDIEVLSDYFQIDAEQFTD
jgi:antitoxin component HigA of HigAB toxin-antitoxin module